MTTPNFRNRTLYHGDNLEFLRGINSETIDLVATDPPFNKGRDFHATPDSLAAGARFHDRWSWEKDVEGEWIDQIRTDWPAVQEVIDAANHTWGEDMGAFLCYMGVRLMEMHRVLKPTGSLWLHCDDTASAYLTMLLDAIFGRRNRRGVITWERTVGGGNDSKNFGRISDTLLYYAKQDGEHTWNKQHGPLSKTTADKYSLDDNDGRGKYFLDNVGWPKTTGGYEYDLGMGEKMPSAGYRMTRETAEQWLADGSLVVRPGRTPRRKRYLSDSRGVALGNVWRSDEITVINSQSRERTGYPTQKPIDLYKRIIAASSNPDDMVLDPFCGCATTLIAAEQLSRQWIGIDLWDDALDVVRTRVEEECQNLFGGSIVYSESPPERTDDKAIAAPPLKTKRKGARRTPEPGPVLPREEMIELLLERQEGKCAGCDRRYADKRIWQIDHLNPRSAGGVNHDSNRCLLCPPCNGIKSDTMTLPALRNHNRKNGLMAT